MPHNPTMPKIRISPGFALTLLGPLGVWAQQAAKTDQAPPAPPPAAAAAKPQAKPAAPEPPTEAEKLLDEAIKKVAALKAISADIEQTVDMLGQHFALKGQYMRGPDYRIYLKLDLAGLGDASGRMLQICDGKVLWDYQKILNSESYTKLEIQKVLRKLEEPGIDPEMRQQIISSMGFTGPDALLSGLRKSLKFYKQEEDTLDGRKVWVLYGEWKDRAALTGANQQPLPSVAPLPAYVPSVAKVFLGQDDGWPYRVQLEGKIPTVLADLREIGPDGKPIGAKTAGPKVDPTKITLVYGNVQLNPELKPELFAFQAPQTAEVIDATSALLDRLESAAAAGAAQKGSEALKEEALPQIPVPKPASDSLPTAPSAIEDLNPPAPKAPR
jgi:outer membrane lipoprotein-sorting protein